MFPIQFDIDAANTTFFILVETWILQGLLDLSVFTQLILWFAGSFFAQKSLKWIKEEDALQNKLKK